MTTKIDLKGLEDFAEKHKRQIPFALSKAMNQVAFSTKKAWGDEAKRAFDRPTRTTINAGYVYKKAFKKKLVTVYGLKDFMPKGTAPDTYLLAQIEGGGRRDKRSEKQLKMKGLLAPTDQLVVLPAIQNSFGNVTKGKMTKILSDLQSFNEMGFNMNAQTNKKYFAVTMRGDRGKLHPGIWERMGKNKIRPVILFVKAPMNYRKRFDYYGVAKKVLDSELNDRFKVNLLLAAS